MRVVGGHYKGRSLAAPKGRNTRPTSDRARETLFNILSHAPWAPALQGARCIDLFAGSGALGLEALSRGADFGLFVETDPGACQTLRANIVALDVEASTKIYRRSATRLGACSDVAGARFDVAFLDPPYTKDMVAPSLHALRQGGWLSDRACLIVETARDEVPDFTGFDIVNDRPSGAAKLWFLRPV